MKNKMEDLRNHLFAELERLGELKEPTALDIARAKATSEVAGKLIDSARVEVEFRKLQADYADPKRVKSEFIEGTPLLAALPSGKASS